jgi:hypothetical protein
VLPSTAFTVALLLSDENVGKPLRSSSDQQRRGGPATARSDSTAVALLQVAPI